MSPPDLALDLLITNGRVLDPDTGLDGPLDLGIAGDRIVHVGSTAPAARSLLDATGCLVVPGFVDLHSHAQSILGARLQAFDGVATALDLEAGRYPVADALGVSTFTHARYIGVEEPRSSLAGVLEVIVAAAVTGANMPLCHLNSTANRQLDIVAYAVERARANGVRISTEAYPHGSGVTNVGAAFLDPGNLPCMGMSPEGMTYLRTGERIGGPAQLERLRSEDPAGLVVVRWADETLPDDRRLLRPARSLIRGRWAASQRRSAGWSRRPAPGRSPRRSTGARSCRRASWRAPAR